MSADTDIRTKADIQLSNPPDIDSLTMHELKPIVLHRAIEYARGDRRVISSFRANRLTVGELNTRTVGRVLTKLVEEDGTIEYYSASRANTKKYQFPNRARVKPSRFEPNTEASE